MVRNRDVENDKKSVAHRGPNIYLTSTGSNRLVKIVLEVAGDGFQILLGKLYCRAWYLTSVTSNISNREGPKLKTIRLFCTWIFAHDPTLEAPEASTAANFILVVKFHLETRQNLSNRVSHRSQVHN